MAVLSILFSLALIAKPTYILSVPKNGDVYAKRLESPPFDPYIYRDTVTVVGFKDEYVLYEYPYLGYKVQSGVPLWYFWIEYGKQEAQ